MVILVVSHIPLLLEALTTTLRGVESTQAFKASSREEVETLAIDFPPNLVVVDALHPEGRALVAAIRQQVPQSRVIVLAMHDRDEDFLGWAEIGISGYLGSDTSARDIVSAVRCVGAGEVVFSSRLTALMLRRLATGVRPREAPRGIQELTSREREVAALLAEGMSNKLIARRLCLAVPTAKNHVHSILDKWGVQSRGEAAARYRQQTRPKVEQRN